MTDWIPLGLMIAAFLLVSLIMAVLLRRYANASIYLGIISMIRSEKPVAWFDQLAKHQRFWRFIGSIGTIIGFGALGVDALYFQKEKNVKRFLFVAASFALLSALFYFTLGTMIRSPSGGDVALVSSLIFGAFGAAGFVLFSLFENAVDIIIKTIAGEKAIPGVAPLIPGVQIPNVPLFVPLHGWLSLLIILVVHEFSHGIVARLYKIPVKNAGIILLGFLPIGAFVEPDEKSVQKMPENESLHLLAAGPMSNMVLFVLALVAFLAFSAVFVSPYSDSQVVIQNVLEFTTATDGNQYPSPAFGVLEKGMIVTHVNGVAVSSVNDFKDELTKSESIVLIGKDANGIDFEKTVSKNAEGRLGIEVTELKDMDSVPFAPFIIAEFLFWLAILNFLVGFVNFLPMPPFDGGRMVMIIGASYLSGKNVEAKRMRVGKFFLYGTLVLIIINVLPLFI